MARGHGEFVLTDHSRGRGRFCRQPRASAVCTMARTGVCQRRSRGRCLVASTSRIDSQGPRHERLLVLVDGRSICSPIGVSLRARTCPTNPAQKQMGGERRTQVVPDL